MTYRDDELDEDGYVEEESPPARGTQRLLIIILGVGCLALATSNVFLAMRVTQLRRAAAVERPAAVPDAAATAPTPTAPATESASVEPPLTAPSAAPPSSSTTEPAAPDLPPSAERPAVTRKPSAATTAARPRREASEPPAPAASIATPAPAAEPARRPTRDVAAPAPEPARAPDLPPSARAREQARVAAVTRATERIAPAPSIGEGATRERATATWMVQEYGWTDAEHRARAVADFYGAHSPDGAYWRRVLAEIAGRR